MHHAEGRGTMVVVINYTNDLVVDEITNFTAVGTDSLALEMTQGENE